MARAGCAGLLALGALGTLYALAGGFLSPSWRGAAAALAVILLLAGLMRIVLSRHPTVVVLVLQLLLVPEVALVAFAAGAGAFPSTDAWIPIAIFAIACELLFAFVVFMNRRTRSKLTTVTFALLDSSDDRALLARVLTVLALSAILAMFDPWFGVLNVLANAAWVCLWIPRRWRKVEYNVDVVEINAPPDRVFEFATDPGNWAQYRSDLEVVSVEPPGKLRSGTRYTVRRKLPGMRAGREVDLVTGYLVTDLVPSKRYTVLTPERPLELATTEFDASGSGTRITIRNHGILRLALAIGGVKFILGRELATRRAADVKRYSRLKELIEQPVAQA